MVIILEKAAITEKYTRENWLIHLLYPYNLSLLYWMNLQYRKGCARGARRRIYTEIRSKSNARDETSQERIPSGALWCDALEGGKLLACILFSNWIKTGFAITAPNWPVSGRGQIKRILIGPASLADERGVIARRLRCVMPRVKHQLELAAHKTRGKRLQHTRVYKMKTLIFCAERIRYPILIDLATRCTRTKNKTLTGVWNYPQEKPLYKVGVNKQNVIPLWRVACKTLSLHPNGCIDTSTECAVQGDFN